MISDSGTPGSSNEAMDIARDWIVRLRSKEVTQSELDELARWRAASEHNRRAFALVKMQWDLFKTATTVLEQAEAKQSVNAVKMAVTRRAWLGGALAASVGGVGYFAVRPPLGLWPSVAELNADHRTGVGERRQIDVDAGISIDMNTRTSLASLNQADGARRLELINGEIAVTMAQTAVPRERPLVVVAGAGRVSATRATFNLRSDQDGMSVACLDGTVELACGGKTLTLMARQRVDYAGNVIGRVATADDRIVAAWRRGLIVFENRPLTQVVAEINRYRRGYIMLANDRIGELSMDATFRLDRIDDAVTKIAELFDLRVRSLPGGLVLLG